MNCALRRVLDPQDVYGLDFPWGGETSRVLMKSQPSKKGINSFSGEGEGGNFQNRDTLATQNLLIAAYTYDRVVFKQHGRH
jgi:hypothetical protein